MPKQVLQTTDSQVWLGWPTEDSGDAYVQLGVIHGDDSAWAELDADGIDRLRRDLQRAKRRVYGRTDDEATTVINVQASGVASTREIVAALERHVAAGGKINLR